MVPFVLRYICRKSRRKASEGILTSEKLQKLVDLEEYSGFRQCEISVVLGPESFLGMPKCLERKTMLH
jgi:hypothetical protein